ncbi:uncharacterized protein LOC105422889 [Pogonomyrmex barbatus]|uniref:Uncharacterized protein LOC105422889 n=1 Tax=Pogonomyrmex barbatus TaxID=144034 RepID=A0A6I9VPW1_9HYME|nr:uncharacterized protein LOC105422889 [Pogonomyrmex barbatus]
MTKVCQFVVLSFGKSMNIVLVTYGFEAQDFIVCSGYNMDAMCSPDTHGNNGIYVLFRFFHCSTNAISEDTAECSPYGWRFCCVSKYASDVAYLRDFTAIRLGRLGRRCFAATMGFLTSDR